MTSAGYNGKRFSAIYISVGLIILILERVLLSTKGAHLIPIMVAHVIPKRIF